MAKVEEFEMFLMIDEHGDYVVAKDREALMEAYDNDIGSDSGTTRRVVCVTLKVPLPEIVDLKGEVPVDAEPTGLVVTA